MRRLKRSAERAAASSHALTHTARFSASKRIPSWNCIARENSSGSLEDEVFVASTGYSWTHRNPHDGSDSESETVDLHTWTRSGGPLMRTTSADQFIDFVQSLDIDGKLTKATMGHSHNPAIQTTGKEVQLYQSSRVTTPDRSSDSEFDQRDFNSRVPVQSSSIVVAEGDLLQPERTRNGILFNVVKKEDLTPSNRSHDSENDHPLEISFDEFSQIDCLDKEIDSSSTTECSDNEVNIENFANEVGHGGQPEMNSGSEVGDSEKCTFDC